MLVQRFEPQGRRFTDFHYYYYLHYYLHILIYPIKIPAVGEGHSVQLSLPKDAPRAKLYNVGKARLYNVEIGGKTSAYVLDNVHMHFGNSHHRGSEHVINGQAFQGEVPF